MFDEIRGMLFDDFTNGGSFESQWMGLNPDLREHLMYSALHGAAWGTGVPRYKYVHSFSTVSSVHADVVFRCSCPDITVTRFAREDPKALLMMMRHVVKSAIDHPQKNDYYPIECEEFDKAHSINRNTESGGGIPIERSRRGAQTIQVNRKLLSLFSAFYNTDSDPLRLG